MNTHTNYGQAELEAARADNLRLEAENAELRKVVEQWPHTCDGVPAVPGMVMYKAGGFNVVHTDRFILSVNSYRSWYSTEQAAREAYNNAR
jgi:hypothetical protein